jgi:hypothetical protein
MLALILAAAVSSQVFENDFYFMKATEDWIIDNAKPPIRYSTFIPKELCEQVDLWNDDCFRCRRRANEAVVRMGPSMVRWLFYPLRAKSLSVKLHTEAVINKLIACRFCDGLGVCVKFSPMKDFPHTCERCWFYDLTHQYENPRCVHCGGGPFEVNIAPFDRGRSH